jgi:hypothetical protein
MMEGLMIRVSPLPRGCGRIRMMAIPYVADEEEP